MKTDIYELLKILEEKIDKLKEENETLKIKIDAYELYGDQHEEEYNQDFNQGTEAAWELARKIILPQSQGGMNDDDYVAIFGAGRTEAYIMKNYTYSEAAAKVAQWEKEKEEIKVGDIIKAKCYEEKGLTVGELVNKLLEIPNQEQRIVMHIYKDGIFLKDDVRDVCQANLEVVII